MTITKESNMNENMHCVVESICLTTQISKSELMSRKRYRYLVDAKRMCYSAIREIYGYPYTIIGGFFRMDHANIIHHLKAHKNLLEWDSSYSEKYNNLLTVIQSQESFVEVDRVMRDVTRMKNEIELKQLLIKQRVNEIETENIGAVDEQASFEGLGQ
tara:strand:- start:7189 stop:7662 length:474 start_codon:yes stop_codon:yes gene_type:complete